MNPGIVRFGLLSLLMAAAPAAAQSGVRAYGDLVVCESDGGRYQYCRADTRGGVVLHRQVSRSECIQGRSWDYDRGGIWVDLGCRAEFMLGDSGYGRPPSGVQPGLPLGGRPPGYGEAKQIVVCESVKGRRGYCAVETWRGVELVRQLSRSPCIERRTWGHDRNGIWVDEGCRAEFAVATRGGGGIHRPGELLVCESYGNRMEHCQTGVIRGARLVRRLSDAACRQNHSWGWNRFGVWVKYGCRAEFEIY